MFWYGLASECGGCLVYLSPLISFGLAKDRQGSSLDLIVRFCILVRQERKPTGERIIADFGSRSLILLV